MGHFKYFVFAYIFTYGLAPFAQTATRVNATNAANVPMNNNANILWVDSADGNHMIRATKASAIIPTNTNQLTNGSGYLISSDLTWNAISGKPVFFDGNYNSLSNKPALFSGSYADLTGKPTLFSGAYNDLTGKPTLFSGNYNDLTNKPTIPAALPSQTSNGGKFLKTDGSATSWDYPSLSVNNVSRSLNSSFQISTTRDAIAIYCVRFALQTTLIGSQGAGVHLETSPDNSTWTTIASDTASTGIALAIAITLNTTQGAQVMATVPKGYYVRLRTTGNGSVAYLKGQESYY